MNVFQLLQSFAELTAIVGQNMYPILLPNSDVIPAITFWSISIAPDDTVSSQTVWHKRVQFDCIAKSFDDADNLRDTLITSLQGYSGQVGDTYLNDCRMVGGRDIYEDTIQMYRLTADFVLTY